VSFFKILHEGVLRLFLLKVKGSSEILGGYNPLEWKSDDSYGITNDSFILSFNNDRIEDYILSRVTDGNNGNNATNNCTITGPSFGISDLMYGT
jgi:hypothetical protein